MTTIPRPSGFVRVDDTSRIQIDTTGSVVCSQTVQDYVPPGGTQLSTWIDFGDSGTSTTRAGGTITIPGRSATTATGDPSTVPSTAFALDAASTFAVSRQNDRTVVHFGTASTGINGTWGPFGTSGSWTIMMFLKVDRPVDDYGTIYTGLGHPMVLLSSPNVNLNINLPSGGSVSDSAVYNSVNETGRIDGVVAGAPWDVPFVNHWRQLCVQNNATTNQRTVYVDGWLVSTSTASSTSVPSGTSVVIGSECPMALAELLVWDGASLTVTEMRQTCDAQRVKWGVTLQPTATTTSVPAQLSLPTALVQTVPPPTPNIWLDSTRGVYSNAAGTTGASAFSRVRVWKDSGTSGNDCTFAIGCNATYGTGPLACINAKLPVISIPSGPGVFKMNPLTGTTSTGYTVLCVWRVAGGGGHPFSATTPASVISETEWTERLGSEVALRPTPLPTSALTSGSVVVGCWERSPSGQSTWRINTMGDSGGYRWTGMVPVSAPPTDWFIGTSGRGLELGQLMVWYRILTSTEREVVTVWLRDVWGIVLPSPASGSIVPNAIPSAGVPAAASLKLWLDATFGLYSTAPMQSASVANGPVVVWCDRTSNARNVTFSNAQLVQQAQMPYVAITDTGTFPAGKQSPLATVGAGPFTIVAVWNVLTTNGGGHPYNPGGKSVFSSTTWTEYMAASGFREMTVPSGITGMGPLCGCWFYDGSTLTFQLGSITGSNGYRWTSSPISVPSSWTASQVVIGTVGKGLRMAEVLVWPAALTNAQLASLELYLVVKWNLPTYGSPAALYPLPSVTGTDPLITELIIARGQERLQPFDAFLPECASDLSATTNLMANVSQWGCQPNGTGLFLNGTSGFLPQFSKSMRGFAAVNFTSSSGGMTLNANINSYNSCGIVTFQLPVFASGASGTIILVSEGTDGVNLSVNISTRLLTLTYNGVSVQSQNLVYMQSSAGGYVYTAAWRVVNQQARLWLYYEHLERMERVVVVNPAYTAVTAKTTQGVVTMGGARAGWIHEVRLYPYALGETELLLAAKEMDDTYTAAPINVHRIRIYRSWNGGFGDNKQVHVTGITAYDAANVALAFVGGSVKWAYQTIAYDWHRLTDGNPSTYAVGSGATATNGTVLEAWNEVWVEARAFTKITVHNRTDNNLQSRIAGTRLEVRRNNAITWETIAVFDSTNVADVYNFVVNVT